MKSRVSVVLAMTALAVIALPTIGRANLLVEGGFENNNLAPLGSIVAPLTPALWGYEAASDVTLGNGGILPRTGHWMLEMKDDGLSWTQAIQFVDITAYPTLHAGAFFNSDAPGATAALVLIYYTNAAGWGADIGQDTHVLTLDNNTSTWETIDFISTRPVGATWVGVEIMFSDPSIRPDYAGYVDDVSLDSVPEPSSVAALLTGVAGVAGFGIRRRKTS